MRQSCKERTGQGQEAPSLNASSAAAPATSGPHPESSVAQHSRAVIKPEDMVRTPSGRTCICEAINRDGSRALRDVMNGEQFDLKPQHLLVVRAAPVKPWKGRSS